LLNASVVGIRQTVPMDCVFCQIVARVSGASIVHEDDRVIAFCDLFPVNPGHLLVVPKVHAVGLGDLDEADGQRMFVVAQRLAGAVRRTGLQCAGVNLFLADGAAALQEVFHAHLHVIPRFVGDKFRLSSGQSPFSAPRAELDVVAGQIRDAL
jgi:diadenosine tetraphosphate (Ap4A) HIT family hydrolase